MNAIKPWILLVVALLLDTAGATLFKLGMNKLPPNEHAGLRDHLRLITQALRRKEIALGVAVYVFESIAWLGVLSYAALSVAFPLFSANNILILLASYFFLGERVGRARWLGAVLIVIGIVLVGG
jgi:drug/metabolite transporter (DMT)-like permease